MPNAVVVSYALTFFIALLASWAILSPFFEVSAEDELPGKDKDSQVDLHLKKERVFDALEDLEQDFRTSRLTEADYETAKDELLVEAAECLQKLDKTSPDVSPDPDRRLSEVRQGKAAGRK